MVSNDALFRFRSDQDYKDSTQVIAEADQGGLGLPDRDYYLKTDAEVGGASQGLRSPFAEDVRIAWRQADRRRGRSRRRSCGSKPRWPKGRSHAWSGAILRSCITR